MKSEVVYDNEYLLGAKLVMLCLPHTHHERDIVGVGEFYHEPVCGSE